MDLNGIETDWNYIGIEPSTIGISYAVVSKNIGLNHQIFGDKNWYMMRSLLVMVSDSTMYNLIWEYDSPQ